MIRKSQRVKSTVVGDILNLVPSDEAEAARTEVEAFENGQFAGQPN